MKQTVRSRGTSTLKKIYSKRPWFKYFKYELLFINIFRLSKEKPLLGIPFTTKDCFAVEGLSYTAGLLARGKRNER